MAAPHFCDLCAKSINGSITDHNLTQKHCKKYVETNVSFTAEWSLEQHRDNILSEIGVVPGTQSPRIPAVKLQETPLHGIGSAIFSLHDTVFLYVLKGSADKTEEEVHNWMRAYLESSCDGPFIFDGMELICIELPPFSVAVLKEFCFHCGSRYFSNTEPFNKSMPVRIASKKLGRFVRGHSYINIGALAQLDSLETGKGSFKPFAGYWKKKEELLNKIRRVPRTDNKTFSLTRDGFVLKRFSPRFQLFCQSPRFTECLLEGGPHCIAAKKWGGIHANQNLGKGHTSTGTVMCPQSLDYNILNPHERTFMTVISAAVTVALVRCLATKQRNAVVNGGGLQMGRDLTLFSGLLASSEECMAVPETEEQKKGERPWGPLQNIHADRARTPDSLKRSGNATAACRTAVPLPPPPKRVRHASGFYPRRAPAASDQKAEPDAGSSSAAVSI